MTRVSDDLRRLRRSTIVLIVLFLAVLALYFLIRPDDVGASGSAPKSVATTPVGVCASMVNAQFSGVVPSLAWSGLPGEPVPGPLRSAATGQQPG